MRRVLASLLLALGVALPGTAPAEPLAKTVFGAQKSGAAGKPESFGFYSKGCFSGGVAIATDGPAWQAMRLSRNRRWGHPEMIATIEALALKAQADGWPGLLVGDISQPRGGPMLTGHASHQLGLDADIWLTPMPDRRLSPKEREEMSAISMLKGDSLYVDDAKWTPAHGELLRNAAQFPNVERVLVHPGIKKKLCDTITGDRRWLAKVRPYWGHFYHFHIRIGCPAGSPQCKGQEAVPSGDGCGKDLAWWFTDEPWRPAKPGTKPKPPARDVMTMAALPDACRAVAAAPGADGSPAAAALPVAAPAAAPNPAVVPVPTPRPERSG